MKSAMVLLLFLLGSAGSFAASTDERLKTQTHVSLWVTFRTAERLPTADTAKKITARALQNCENWRKQARKNFSTRISKLPACEKSDGICSSKRSCVSYWATEVGFNPPLTLVNRTRTFFGPKSAQSMADCLKWIQEMEKLEAGRFFWSTCSYEEPLEENGDVTGSVESLAGPAAASPSRLLMHHHKQLQNPNVIFQQFTASSLEISFPFTLRKNRADKSDPEFANSLSQCEQWRNRSVKKFLTQGAEIEACRLGNWVACNASDPPSCSFSHSAKILWKGKRTLYTIERTFVSPEQPAKGFDACSRWLKDEEDFAPAETIDGKCAIGRYESGGGTQTYYIKGTFHQVELE